MKRGIYFIAEGATEVQFIESSLRHYFISKGIYDIRAFDMGGSNSYSKYYRDVTTFLKREEDIIVTSMIDFFRLPTDFPGYNEAKKLKGAVNQITAIEKEVSNQIKHKRFVPYIQLHEFEGLLFTDMRGFSQIPSCDAKALSELKEIVDTYQNPELINDGPETAPSKRLKKIIPGYDKPLYGSYIALENGLESIINKCPRFRNWLEILEAKALL
ncbi:MAG: DUF4276 family protein [Chitinophagaceae bacterium]|nr:DUF4276 family protein [Chitinophagaceae bacterium]